MTLRRRLSDLLNRLLYRIGYAFVRVTDGDDNPAILDATQTSRYTYENIILLNTLAPWSSDQEFLKLRKLVLKNTLVDTYRCYELFQLVREVSVIPGDILEVGVWRGGTGAILAAAAKRWKPNSQVWLCDTFKGVVKAGARDSAYVGGEHADTSIEIVKNLIAQIYVENVRILSGVFPDETATEIDTPHIALCHVDVDVYQSAADIVKWVKPRMIPGSCLVFDDYGFSTCQGITRIVDELRDSGDWMYIYNLNKHAILIKR
jgi:O-methyltransferase